MCAQISIRVTGLDKVQTGFNKFASTLGVVTREQSYHALELAVKVSPAYQGGNEYNVPLPPSGVNVRTGALGSSVQLEQSGLSSRVTITGYSKNGYLYGTKVLGDAEGAGQGENYHHWPLIRKAVDDQIAVLVAAGGPADKAIAQSAVDAGL